MDHIADWHAAMSWILQRSRCTFYTLKQILVTLSGPVQAASPESTPAQFPALAATLVRLVHASDEGGLAAVASFAGSLWTAAAAPTGALVRHGLAIDLLLFTNAADEHR